MNNNRKNASVTGKFVDHPLQTIMSRAGSFPLGIAYNLLSEYGGRSSIVLDPFCGKGTTLLAGRILGYPVYGIDIAPEAVVCTLAKLVDVSPESVRRYIHALPFNGSSHADVPMSVRTFFHPATLTQILGARNQLLHDVHSKEKELRVNAIFTLACLLGILHGHASDSLSVPSAHAYSMAPAYVKKFAAEHRLKKPIRDVKECLIKKTSRCLSVPLPKFMAFGVNQGSALTCSTIFPELVGKVDLILTSPPYLNAQTYAKDNWLRLWLLGYNYKDLKHDYIETCCVQRYGDYMEKVFEELNSLLKPGGRLICIAGDVRLRNRNGDKVRPVFKTGFFLANLCESKTGLQIEKHEKHKVPSNSRYLHAISNSNGHSKRSLIERVFIARKPKDRNEGG
ncbi:MAG: hypothetical protein HYS56_01980 [Candidatus Omnitrophica bacterium]|nr:hypothetical protein [Candidatus Omnitrophota bacterium]